MLAHNIERLSARHAGELAGERHGGLEHCTSHVGLLHRTGRQPGPAKRINYRLAFFLAGLRSRTLAAAGFFFSASILALRASKRLTTFGAGACLAGSIFLPACLR